MKKFLLGVAALFFVAVGFQGTPQAAPAYKIGIVTPLSGVFAVYGQNMLEGFKIKAEEINASGGILGRQIEIIDRDSKGKPDAGVRETKDLILRDGVEAIMGIVSSAVNLAVIEVTREYKTIHITTNANTEKASLERIHPYYFQLTSNTYMEAMALMRRVAKMNIKNYIPVVADFEWGQSSYGIFEPALAKERPDVKVIRKFFPKLGEVDFTTSISAIISEKPDVCIGWLTGNDSTNFLRQARSYGLFEKVKYITVLHEDELRDLKAEIPTDIMIYSRGPFYAIDNPKMNAFQKKFISRRGWYAPFQAIMSYDGLTCLAEAIKRAGSFDKDAIAKQLEGGKFSTLRADLYFRPIDHMMNSPIYFSTTTFDKSQGICIGKDVMVVPGDTTWRTPEEIKKIRVEKKISFTPWHDK